MEIVLAVCRTGGNMPKGHYKRKSKPFDLTDGGIDVGLSMLITRPNTHTINTKDIAFVCGCSRKYIEQLQRNAIAKLRKAFQERGINEGSF